MAEVKLSRADRRRARRKASQEKARVKLENIWANSRAKRVRGLKKAIARHEEGLRLAQKRSPYARAEAEVQHNYALKILRNELAQVQ